MVYILERSLIAVWEIDCVIRLQNGGGRPVPGQRWGRVRLKNSSRDGEQ